MQKSFLVESLSQQIVVDLINWMIILRDTSRNKVNELQEWDSGWALVEHL